jgi:hypothetical protein
VKVRPVAIIWCAIALHVLWGVLLLFSGDALGATALHAFAGMPRLLTAAILFAVAALAAVGVSLRGPRRLTLALLLPQQAVLTISAMSAVMAVISSRYGDGVPRPWYFILADQAPVILTMVLHTIAVIQLHMAGDAPNDDLPTKLAAVQEEAERLRKKLADRRGELAGDPLAGGEPGGGEGGGDGELSVDGGGAGRERSR